jgi:hypothetical protein
MEEALVEKEEPIVADEETAKVAQMSEGALDFPALAIAPQRASVLKDNSTAAPMRTDQLNPTGRQALTEALGVVSPVTNEPLWAGAGTTCTRTGHLHCPQGFFGKGDLRGRGAKESTSQRNTLAVCHHHPLRTFATFGFTHAEPLFLAAAKLPSINTSLQLSFPCSSSSQRKRRHSVSHTSSSSQSRSRRQQVLALGYFWGRSRQRAPLRSTHRMPSKTARSSARGPPKTTRRR